MTEMIFEKSEDFKSSLAELLEKGLSYRYLADHHKNLCESKRGKLFPSNTQSINVEGTECVEELFQPTLFPIKLSLSENLPSENDFKNIAKIWTALIDVEWKLYNLSRDGKIDPDIAQSITSDEEKENSNVDPGYQPVLPFVRLDCVYSKQYGLKVVDVNSTRPAGVGYLGSLTKFYENLYEVEHLSSVWEEYKNGIWDCYTQWNQHFDKHRINPNLGLVTPLLEGDFNNFIILQKVFCSDERFNEIKVIDPLKNRENYQDYSCFIRGKIKEETAGFSFLTSDYPENKCIISPLWKRFLGNKLWFLFFKKYKTLFHAELGELYDQCATLLPETGIIKKGQIFFENGSTPIDKLNRKEWIIKDPSGSSAIGMTFGRDVTQTKWIAMAEKCAEKCTYPIVQRCFTDTQYPLWILDEHGNPIQKNLWVKFGIFIINGKFAGIEVMARPSIIVHGARDTYISSVCK